MTFSFDKQTTMQRSAYAIFKIPVYDETFVCKQDLLQYYTFQTKFLKKTKLLQKIIYF